MCSKGTQDICMVMHFESSWHSVGMRRESCMACKAEGHFAGSQDSKFDVSYGDLFKVVLDMLRYKL